MITHRDLAKLQLDVYADYQRSFDYLADGRQDNGVVYGWKWHAEGFTSVSFRGSATFLDWIRDFWAAADPLAHGVFGPIHPGFDTGMEIAWQHIAARTDGPYVICGHSLGAAHATLATARAKRDGKRVIERVVWGEPMSGFQPLADYLGGIKSTSYRNAVGKHFDRVTSVPFELLIERYVRAGHLTDISAPPPDDDPWGPLRYHHMPLYVSRHARNADHRLRIPASATAGSTATADDGRICMLGCVRSVRAPGRHSRMRCAESIGVVPSARGVHMQIEIDTQKMLDTADELIREAGRIDQANDLERRKREMHTKEHCHG